MRKDEALLLGGAAALWFLSSESSSGLAQGKTGAPSGAAPSGGVVPYVARWPMPVLLVAARRGADQGKVIRYSPQISDGLHLNGRPRYHPGVDMMYRRQRRYTAGRKILNKGLLTRNTTWDERHFTDGAPNASPGGWYFCPPDIPVTSIAAGRVWHASATPAGGQVTVDHGSYVSIYLHLSRLSVPRTLRGIVQEGERKGQALPVMPTTALGRVGWDPRQGSSAVRHLHLELITYDRGAKTYHDAAPLLAGAAEWTQEHEEGSTTIEP